MNWWGKSIKKFLGFEFIDLLLTLVSAVTGCGYISALVSLVAIPVGITSSLVGSKICEITAEIKKYNSVIKKMKNEHDKIVLLAQFKLNIMEFLICQVLFVSNITHDEFVSAINVLNKCDDMKEEIKNSDDK